MAIQRRKFNVRNAQNTAWENLLKDINIEIVDADNLFKGNYLDEILKEIKRKLDTVSTNASHVEASSICVIS